MRFRDRAEAGSLLAKKLEPYRGQPIIIYALPRGGVVLGAEVARELGASLELLIPRKIGHPSSSEYAIAATTAEGAVVSNPHEVKRVDPAGFKLEVERQRAEAQRRQQIYIGSRASIDPRGKVAIIVDDGIATGLTMLAAIAELKPKRPAKIVVAVPVIPADTAGLLRREADEVVALDIPEHYLGAVGAYYDEFSQVQDDQVVSLLEIGNRDKE